MLDDGAPEPAKSVYNERWSRVLLAALTAYRLRHPEHERLPAEVVLDAFMEALSKEEIVSRASNGRWVLPRMTEEQTTQLVDNLRGRLDS